MRIGHIRFLLVITLVVALVDARGQLANNGNNNSGAAVFARVDATGFTGNGTGIRGVTFTNLTQNTTAIVQSFFAAGGVDPQPNPQNQVATTPPAAGAVLVGNGVKGLIDYRSQLVGERMRLVQLIANKRRDRQSSAIETAQAMAIERAIQQADNRLARRGFRDPSLQVPAENPAAVRQRRAAGER